MTSTAELATESHAEFIERWRLQKCGTERFAFRVFIYFSVLPCVVYVAAFSELPSVARNLAGFAVILWIIASVVAQAVMTFVLLAIFAGENTDKDTYDVIKSLCARRTMAGKVARWASRVMPLAAIVLAACAGGWWFLIAAFLTCWWPVSWFAFKLVQSGLDSYLEKAMTPEVVAEHEGVL